ncbi:MAG: hypothetical protein LV480_04740 [Methylacidiphilales bacterium]|nr:hypothetical protein [Candidatus Methylacidiphilales bacterium]
MLSRAFRSALFCLALIGLGTISRGGMTTDTPYSNRGKTDFDTALQILNSYGTWSKIDGKWAYTPRDHMAPYTNGRWIYTDYGWYWKGSLPHSWMTEHYGYWKRGPDKVWSWYPGPFWLPQTVEIRATATYIGWRSGEVDDEGGFVEAPVDRYSKPDEWTFVTRAQFANPITPPSAAPLAVAEDQLDDSTNCWHTYLTYREIDRPGPHPADIAPYCKDGGMLAPGAMEEEASAQPAQTGTVSTNAPAAKTTGTNAIVPPGAEMDPQADTRQVKYWITMSLPTFWAHPPTDARLQEIYLYRPDFYQDQDGIARRITLWFNPKAHTSLADLLGGELPGLKSNGAGSPSGPSSPAVPASTEEGPAHGPFHGTLDESFQPADTNHPASSSSKNPGPAPSGLSSETNAAPAK